MRENLTAPTLEIPADELTALRAFLDGQSRITRAVWVRHGHGESFDHHLVLAVDDEDWRTGEMGALERGIELPPICPRERQWLDIYPVSEVEELRAFGAVIWEQTVPGPDPLDYRMTWEPWVPDVDALARFRERLAEEPRLRRVGGRYETLWNGDRIVRRTAWVLVDAGSIRLNDAVFPLVRDAAKASILADVPNHAMTGLAEEPASRLPTTILYEAA